MLHMRQITLVIMENINNDVDFLNENNDSDNNIKKYNIGYNKK